MIASEPFVDIHCHLLPGIDDGAKSWQESLAMAEIAVDEGVATTIATPHQLGTYAHNDGDAIRQRTVELQQLLHEHAIPLQVVPGADVRIDEPMLAGLRCGHVLTLADRGQHVLLELPHELYFSLDGVLSGLEQANLVGILSHPERNQGLLKDPQQIGRLVRQGCLMQITAGSLLGAFGPAPQQMAEWMLEQGFVHFLATDAHGCRSRRPLLRRAFQYVAELVEEEVALEICCRNPAAVAEGRTAISQPRPVTKRRAARWLPWRRAG